MLICKTSPLAVYPDSVLNSFNLFIAESWLLFIINCKCGMVMFWVHLHLSVCLSVCLPLYSSLTFKYNTVWLYCGWECYIIEMIHSCFKKIKHMHMHSYTCLYLHIIILQCVHMNMYELTEGTRDDMEEDISIGRHCRASARCILVDFYWPLWSNLQFVFSIHLFSYFIEVMLVYSVEGEFSLWHS